MNALTVMAGPISVRISRQFSVSPERLFDVWFQPGLFASFLLADVATPVSRAYFEPRVGGRFLVAAQRDDRIVELRGEYLEIDRPDRLVFSLIPSGDERAPDCVTVELAELGRGSLLVLLHEMDLQWASERARVQFAWNAALGRLAAREPEHAASAPRLASVY